MSHHLPPRRTDSAPRSPLTAARAGGPEADPAQPVTPSPEISDTDSDRHDLDSVEHLRQDRLSRWQEQRP